MCIVWSGMDELENNKRLFSDGGQTSTYISCKATSSEDFSVLGRKKLLVFYADGHFCSKF